jgi:hypothetical protein
VLIILLPRDLPAPSMSRVLDRGRFTPSVTRTWSTRRLSPQGTVREAEVDKQRVRNAVNDHIGLESDAPS